jgi:hypothetical protein
MKKPSYTRAIRAAGFFTLLLGSQVFFPLQACTDLEETPTSSITPENFYKSEQEVIAGLASVYAQLRATTWSYFNLSEITTDEIIVPTRGQDWFDNGRWLEIHRQLWAANSPSALEDLNGAWVDAFTGVARANVVLAALANVTVTDKAVVEAELRTLRAFYYYILMDLFGGVPIVKEPEIAARPRATRAEVFQFIETELNEARAALPASWPAGNNGRMTKGVADAILASMYLNAGVFTKDAGISATGYNSCSTVQVGGQSACAAAVTAAQRVRNAGVYNLASDWRSNFSPTNDASPENIMVVKFINQADLGLNFIHRGLHYAQYNPSPWNGFATLAETYGQFDAADQRRQIFLVGQQVDQDPKSSTYLQPVKDRSGQPLVFTPEIRDATKATEGEGVRILKYPPDPGHVGPDNGNDFVYFRLGEIYLIEAEALNESGQTAAALALVNTLRNRVFNPAKPLVGLSQAALRDQILKERLFELTAEAKRRPDLIRYGQFTRQWSTTMLNGKQQREPHRVLMPIPQQQMDANPQLTQNPGY